MLLVEPIKAKSFPTGAIKMKHPRLNLPWKFISSFEFYHRQQNDFCWYGIWQMKIYSDGYTRARRYANYKGGKKICVLGWLPESTW